MLLGEFVNTCVILLELYYLYDQQYISRFILTLLTGSWVILHKKVVQSFVHASNIIYRNLNYI